MDVTDTLVDDFLSGSSAIRPANTSNHQPHSYMTTKEDEAAGRDQHTSPPPPSAPYDIYARSPAAVPRAGGTSAILRNPQTISDLFALQQRLIALMAEAKAIITQLLQYGMFPSGEGGDEGPEAATNALFMNMLFVSQRERNEATAQSSAEQRDVGAPAQPYWNTANNNSNATSADSRGIMAMLTHGTQQQQQQQHDSSNYFTVGTPAARFEVQHLESAAAEVAGRHDVPADPPESADHPSPNAARAGARGGNKRHKTAGGASRGGDGLTQQVSMDALSENTMLAFVEFKRGRVRKYVCDQEEIEPGTYVLVDGDRGTDCGLLVQTIQRSSEGEIAVVCMDGCDVKDERVKLENGRVLRAASNEDIDRLHNIIANAEAVALKTCRQRCLDLGIDIDLIDVEYQFDMKKISFFFDCDHSVDFRALVRELYRTFGARIWMENVNPKVKNAMPEYGGGGGGGHGRNAHGRRR